MPSGGTGIGRQVVFECTRGKRDTGIDLLSAGWLRIRAVDKDLIDAIVVGASQETINAIVLIFPCSVLRTRDVFESINGVVGLNGVPVSFARSTIRATSSDGIVGVDVDDLSTDDTVLI